ncbi:toprim domain-containing protein [Helicobacter pullorum]|uniref:toprim domain-containing protein n=2 Tax=Helicobacter pullorum TaxID=35818 RepID=UPI000816834A|nr:toprim domain-containing protein [Helicobacter pullorum]OCR03152.1 hypothetical protein BA729_08250 [Helicobacter pullorum]OCR06121.1 hypothetical protein BA185_07765 [Helicobacter pullorum]OCR09577.1 hypothetical protein BA730_08895 [Helicobacter pullorum]
MNEQRKFKNEDKLTLPLDEILLQNGYSYKKDKCSKNFITLTNHNGENLVITRQKNGHYLYFNTTEEFDKGNIFSFCKNRNIKIDQLINNNFDYLELKHNLNPTQISNKAIESINEYKKFLPMETSKSFLKKDRILDENTLKNFSIKQDSFNNACFPTFIFDISINGKDIISQSGYIAYLSTPITKDKGGKKYEKPIKQLCYGSKGLEIIRNPANKQKISDIQNIIITESMIDSLSLFELKGYNPNTTLLCSTNGQLTQSQKELFRYFDKEAKNANIILGFDNDTSGEIFFENAKKEFIQKKITREKPVLKDFNDDLIIAKVFGMDKDFKLDNLSKKVESMENKTRYLLDKDSVLLKDSKERLFKEILEKDMPLMQYLLPKIEKFVETDKLVKGYQEILIKQQNKTLIL